MMRICRLVCLFALVWIVSCGKKEDGAVDQPQVQASSVAKPEPPPLPKPVLALTQELESAAVSVQLVMAASLQREYTGILLRPGALTPPIAEESNLRFFAVHIPEHDEQALRDPKCYLQVRRKKLDPNGASYVVRLQGTLVHFAAETHMAIVQITENFPCRLEAGLAASKGTAEVCLLQAAYNQQLPMALPPPPQQQPLQPQELRMKIQEQQQLQLQLEQIQQQNFHRLQEVQYQQRQMGETFRTQNLPGSMGVSLLAAGLKEGALTVPGVADEEAATGEDAERTISAAVLGSDGGLAGFASRRPRQGWEFQAFAMPPQVQALQMSYVAKSAEIQPERMDYSYNREQLGYTCKVVLKGELKDPLNDFHSCMVAVQNRPAADFTPAPNPQEDQPALTPDGELIQGVSLRDGQLSFELKVPPGGGTTYQLVQVLLQQQADRKVGFHAAPFMIISKMRGAGVYQKVVGLAAAAEAKAGPRELTTESRIVYGLPVCEGREVLFKLDGAPFWKRLSLADGKWLPLPAVDLSLAYLTGNKEALFVLQPGQREIMRYNAKTLALEKTALLPDGFSYQGLAAGCLSADAPVAVIGEEGTLTCDAKNLTVSVNSNQKGNDSSRQKSPLYYLASGDGSQVYGRPNKPDTNTNSSLPVFKYLDVMNGYVKNPNSHMGSQQAGKLPTVGGACFWDYAINTPGEPSVSRRYRYQRPGTACTAPLANSPNSYVVSRGERTEYGKLKTPQCYFYFYSYYSDDPWATVEVPEAGDVPVSAWETFSDRLWLDPSSLTFALWHHDQTITLHTVDKSKLAQPGKPVLLNYPDCFVSRAEDFHFKPLLLGAAAAKFSVSEAPAGFTQGADGTMNWPVPAAALPRELVFGVKITGDENVQRQCDFKLALLLGGQQPVVAVPASMNGESALAAIANLGTGQAVAPLVPLSWRFYKSDRSIQRMLPGLDDYLGLIMEDKSLALFSLKDWKMAGSQQMGDTAAAFMAGDSVLVYRTHTRELTRYTLPSLAVTHRYLIPGTARLIGLGVGTQPAGPVSLLVEDFVVMKKAAGASPFNNLDQNAAEEAYLARGYTQVQRSLLILDKQTLSTTSWAAYNSKSEPEQPRRGGGRMLDTTMMNKELPAQIPTSDDGRLVSFPSGLVMISPTETVEHVYRGNPLAFNIGHDRPVAATPTADRVFSGGQMFLGGLPQQKIGDDSSAVMSRCGNYITSLVIDNPSALIKLYAADDGRPLLNVFGVGALRFNDNGYGSKGAQILPMGEKNLLAVLSQDGHTLQVVNLDLAASCLAANPDSIYVTSHPFPIVAQGQTLDYQVTVSNPNAVDSYELRDQTPGASIDNKGHFTYQAPAKLSEPVDIYIAIMIRLKNGDALLHQFSIHANAPKSAKGGEEAK